VADTVVRADPPAGTLGGGDAVSRFIQASDGVQLHYRHLRVAPIGRRQLTAELLRQREAKPVLGVAELPLAERPV
jgi:hypothetical protein